MNTIITFDMLKSADDCRLLEAVDNELHDTSNPCLVSVMGPQDYRALAIMTSVVHGTTKGGTIYLTLQKRKHDGVILRGYSVEDNEFGNVDRIPEVGDPEWFSVVEAWKRALPEDDRELALAVYDSFVRPF